MKRDILVITVTRQHNGLLLSTVYNGQYHKRLYAGYTVREAKQLFREYLRGGK